MRNERGDDDDSRAHRATPLHWSIALGHPLAEWPYLRKSNFQYANVALLLGEEAIPHGDVVVAQSWSDIGLGVVV